MNTEKSQYQSFKETAREIGADESDDVLDRIMGKLDLKKKPEIEKPALGNAEGKHEHA